MIARIPGAAHCAPSLMIAARAITRGSARGASMSHMGKSHLIIMFTVAVALIRHYLPHAPMFNRVLLQPPSHEEQSTIAQRESLAQLDHLLGTHGVTTFLRKPQGPEAQSYQISLIIIRMKKKGPQNEGFILRCHRSTKRLNVRWPRNTRSVRRLSWRVLYAVRPVRCPISSNPLKRQAIEKLICAMSTGYRVSVDVRGCSTSISLPWRRAFAAG